MCSFALVVAAPLALAAQQPRALPPAEQAFEEPFSQVGALRELSNGRVYIADLRDKVLALVDLAAGSSTKVGREGSGPAEYGMPMRLFTAPGDTTLLFDPLNQRYLVIAPDGKPTSTFRVETPAPASRGDGPRLTIGLSMPRAADARGRLYFESPGFAQGPDGAPRAADSAAITRYDRASKKMDTLTWVKLPKGNTQVSGGGGNVRMMVGGSNPLTARDEWAVFPDGRVAVVRSADYHVDWIMPNGTRQSSPAITFTPIRVTDADKREEESLRNRNRQNQMMMTVENGPNGTRRNMQMGPGAAAPPLEPLTDWPAVKPPFRTGQGSVWARPNGDLWVRRLESAGAKGMLYDVIDAQGAVSFQVRIPEGITLVGFGNGTIYTTKADADDLLYLQRHVDRERRPIGEVRSTR